MDRKADIRWPEMPPAMDRQESPEGHSQAEGEEFLVSYIES